MSTPFTRCAAVTDLRVSHFARMAMLLSLVAVVTGCGVTRFIPGGTPGAPVAENIPATVAAGAESVPAAETAGTGPSGSGESEAEASIAQAGLAAPGVNTLVPVGLTPAVVSPDTGDAFARGIVLLQDGDWESAARVFIALVEAEPGLASVNTNLGLARLRGGELDAAREAFVAALAIAPADCVAWNGLGRTERIAGNVAEARAAYEACIARNPRYALAHLNLGILFEMYLGQQANALAAYQRYQDLQQVPDTRVARWISNLARQVGPDQLAGRQPAVGQ